MISNEEIIRRFNLRQHSGVFHEFTCCSQTSNGEICNRNEHEYGVLKPVLKNDIIIAECPCGKYSQDIPSEIFDDDFIKMLEESIVHRAELFNKFKKE